MLQLLAGGLQKMGPNQLKMFNNIVKLPLQQGLYEWAQFSDFCVQFLGGWSKT